MNIIDLIKYITFVCGSENKIPLKRLVRILFLIDWSSSIENRRQITDIQWFVKKGVLYAHNLKCFIVSSEELLLNEVLNQTGETYQEIELTINFTNDIQNNFSNLDSNIIENISNIVTRSIFATLIISFIICNFFF